MRSVRQNRKLVVFRAKCVTGCCHDGRSRLVNQFWALLLNDLPQMIELLAVFGGIDDLVLWKQLIINYFLDIPSDAQHHLL